MAAGHLTIADLPQVMPVFPLDRALLLPHGMLPLNIFEPRYLNMVDDAMAADRIIGMVQTRVGAGLAAGEGDRGRPALAPVGCAGRITAYAETQDGRYLITLTGVCRFRIGAELPVQTPYRQVRADFAPFEQDLGSGEPEAPDDRPEMLAALETYLQRRGFEVDWRMTRETPLDALVNSLCMALPFDPAEKQALLEAETLQARREALVALLRMGASGGDPASPQVQ